MTSYRPNRYGLHNVHGNVDEWVRDWYSANSYAQKPRAGDGWHQVPTRRLKVYRGGSFLMSASRARSAARTGNTVDYAGNSIGVRPARPLLLSE